MADRILIFGKDTWPYTTSAREAYRKKGVQVEYISVIDKPNQMNRMLKFSDGARKVPVIVDGDDVIIGFDGGSWGV